MIRKNYFHTAVNSTRIYNRFVSYLIVLVFLESRCDSNPDGSLPSAACQIGVVQHRAARIGSISLVYFPIRGCQLQLCIHLSPSISVCSEVLSHMKMSNTFREYSKGSIPSGLIWANTRFFFAFLESISSY